MNEGFKDDESKPQADLLLDFSDALLEVAKVGTYGANKYAPHNWLKVTDGQARYTAAMLRHLLLEENQDNDPETDYLHAAHVAWNALARLELMLQAQNQRKVKNDE